MLAGEAPAPPMDQLAQGLLEVEWIGFELARLERDLPPFLAGRAGDLARRILEAKRSLFPELEEAS